MTRPVSLYSTTGFCCFVFVFVLFVVVDIEYHYETSLAVLNNSLLLFLLSLLLLLLLLLMGLVYIVYGLFAVAHNVYPPCRHAKSAKINTRALFALE